MAGMVVITSPSFSSYCPCWTCGTGWLQLSFVLCFSSCFALSRFAVLWFALPAVGVALVLPAVGFGLLPAVGFALLPAVGFALVPDVGSALVLPDVGFALLPSVGFALLPAVGFALFGSFQRCSSSSRCPRTCVASLRSSHHLLLGCGSFCPSFSDTLC